MIKKLALLLSIALLSSSRVDGKNWFITFLEPSGSEEYSEISHRHGGAPFGIETELFRTPEAVLSYLHSLFYFINRSTLVYINPSDTGSSELYVVKDRYDSLPKSVKGEGNWSHLEYDLIYTGVTKRSFLEKFRTKLTLGEALKYLFVSRDEVPRPESCFCVVS